MVQRHMGKDAARAALANVHAHWETTLGAVRIETPEPTLDVIANGWLMYQTIACRIWARSGYYQSGGAFGFRDQLQDAMATIHTKPQLLRDQMRHAMVWYINQPLAMTSSAGSGVLMCTAPSVSFQCACTAASRRR